MSFPKYDFQNLKRSWILPLAWFSFLLTFIVYLPVFNNDFVNWDDPFFVQKNPHIFRINSANLKWMWTSSYMGNWIPMSWLSLAVDYQWGGLNPQVYHCTNLVLHCLNSLLVFLICLRVLALSRWEKDKAPGDAPSNSILITAFLTSLIFGIHPLHVESVVWASERKDLLCGFFYLLSIFFYLKYRALMNGKKRYLYLCLGSFLLSLLSKSMAVSLPAVIILLDYWPLGRFRNEKAKVFLEKAPFFLAAFAVGTATVIFQSGAGALSDLSQLPLSFRVMNAIHSLAFYVAKTVWPVDLVTFYPIFLRKTFSPEYVLSFFLVMAACWTVFIYRKKIPFLYVAALYYFITIVPVIGVLQVGSQAAADRYAYLPSLGPIFLFAFVLTRTFSKWKWILVLGMIGLAAGLGSQTIQQIGFWRDSLLLWQHELEVCPRNAAYAYSNMADALEQDGMLDEALQFYEIAIQKGPRLTYPRAGRGEVLLKKGLIGQSIEEFKTSINLDRNYVVPRTGLALAYEKKGMIPEALAEAQEATRLDPDDAEAYDGLGLAYEGAAQFDKSLEAFRRAVYLAPDNSRYSRNLMAACRMGILRKNK